MHPEEYKIPPAKRYHTAKWLVLFHNDQKRNNESQPITKYNPVERYLNFKVKQEYTIPVMAKYQVIASKATDKGKSTTSNSIGV